MQLGLGLFAAAFVIGAANQSRTALAATSAAERADEDEAAASYDAGCGATA